MVGLLGEPEVRWVGAPSPYDPKEVISVYVDKGTAGKVASVGWTHKIYSMYYNVMGIPPPVNNVGYHEKGYPHADSSDGIRDTYAVFQGLRRPHIEENGDKSVFIYISKPMYIYERVPDMVCMAKRRKFPDGAVFAIYLKLHEGEREGEVFNWELLKRDADDPRMPENFNNRYDQKRWAL